MFPLIVSEMDDGYLCGEFSRFDCHGVVCVFNIESMWGAQLSIQRMIREPRISSIILIGQCGGSVIGAPCGLLVRLAILQVSARMAQPNRGPPSCFRSSNSGGCEISLPGLPGGEFGVGNGFPISLKFIHNLEEVRVAVHNDSVITLIGQCGGSLFPPLLPEAYLMCPFSALSSTLFCAEPSTLRTYLSPWFRIICYS